MRKGNQRKTAAFFVKWAAVQRVCKIGGDHLVDFPFLRAVPSPPLLVQVSEIDEESCEGEGTSVSMKLKDYRWSQFAAQTRQSALFAATSLKMPPVIQRFLHKLCTE